MAAHPVPVPSGTLEIDFRIPDDGTPTLVCRGRMTIETCGMFKSEVKKWVPLSKLVIVDLSKVTYIDSCGFMACFPIATIAPSSEIYPPRLPRISPSPQPNIKTSRQIICLISSRVLRNVQAEIPVPCFA